MDTLEAIFTRRSIRKYKNTPIPEDDLEEVLRAAMAAPSAGNSQPWRFVVITDRALLDRIPEFHPYAAMVKTAPAAILICADLSLEKFPGNWMLDCSAAVMNLMLAARSLGLGTVWTGIYPQKDREEAFAKHFNLPENIKAHSLVPIGYPAVEFKRQDRFKPERISANAFSS